MKGSVKKILKIFRNPWFSSLMYPYCLSQQEKHKKGWRWPSTISEALTLHRGCCKEEAQVSGTGDDCTAGVHAEEGRICFEVRVVKRKGAVVSLRRVVETLGWGQELLLSQDTAKHC